MTPSATLLGLECAAESTAAKRFSTEHRNEKRGKEERESRRDIFLKSQNPLFEERAVDWEVTPLGASG